MFKKILVANRGEIAVRILRTCREMNIPTVALHTESDKSSLHVRLADECVRLDSPLGFMDADAILAVADAKGADAIHPGYGFLAEQAEFIRACESRGIIVIGPPADVVEMTASKIQALDRVKAAGIQTANFSSCCFEGPADAALHAEANALGYPLVVKSCVGGRGRGAHLVRKAEELDAIVQRAQQEAHAIYGDRRIYLEHAILPARQLGVQILADTHGNLIHLGEREGSLLIGNQKVIEEAPAPSLNQTEREHLWELALTIAKLFDYQNAGTVEFLKSEDGEIYFSEIKARIQVEHPVTEMLTRVDLVREQIRLAAGAVLDMKQSDVRQDGWAMQARISAQDPWNQMMPSPGTLASVHLPEGPEVRSDTYADSGCEVPPEYDPLIAKLVVWGQNRECSRMRLKRALVECRIDGTATTLPLLERLARNPAFLCGQADVESLSRGAEAQAVPSRTLCDLAAAVAVNYQRERGIFQPVIPERVLNGWHRTSRRLPQ